MIGRSRLDLLLNADEQAKDAPGHDWYSITRCTDPDEIDLFGSTVTPTASLNHRRLNTSLPTTIDNQQDQQPTPCEGSGLGIVYGISMSPPHHTRIASIFHNLWQAVC